MEHFDIPVLLKNDAKCAGLAEKTYGALKRISRCSIFMFRNWYWSKCIYEW